MISLPDPAYRSVASRLFARLYEILPGAEVAQWQHCKIGLWRRFYWHGQVAPMDSEQDVQLSDLLHIDEQKRKLVANTEQHLAGLPANNVLLWGARGTGKSTLIQALLHDYAATNLRLVEMRKEDLDQLPMLVELLAPQAYRFIIFCDDLSFEVEDASYKALKSALEGSILKAADNVVIYATSNRRHLVPEYMSDNQQARLVDTELHESEAVEEKISLSDRFGVWLSFYPFRQDSYVDVVRHWVRALSQRYGVEVDLDDPELRTQALQWALARGVRNGRSAQYFARHWVGQMGLAQNSPS